MKSLTAYIFESTQKGFIIVKPGFDKLTDMIIKKLKYQGVDIDKVKYNTLTLDEAKELYKIHKDEDFYDDLCKYMSSGESIAATVVGEDVIKSCKVVKDYMRKNFGKSEMKNVMHSSDSLEHAKKEIKVYFENN